MDDRNAVISNHQIYYGYAQSIENNAIRSYRFTDIVSSKTKKKEKRKQCYKGRNSIKSANIFYCLSEYWIIKHIIDVRSQRSDR